jgi:hypothetical protein
MAKNKRMGVGEEAKAGLRDPLDFRRITPESWCCIDCGMNTAPGFLNRVEFENAAKAMGDAWHNGGSVQQTIGNDSEVYLVLDAVWKQANVEDGCLCVGCLEKRLGRGLKPKDFIKGHPLNKLPGTPRLMIRRDRVAVRLSPEYNDDDIRKTIELDLDGVQALVRKLNLQQVLDAAVRRPEWRTLGEPPIVKQSEKPNDSKVQAKCFISETSR